MNDLIKYTFKGKSFYAPKIEVGDFRLDYNRMWGLGEHVYEVGDIVSRIDRDEHIITAINKSYDLLSIKCIKSYEGCYCRVGETEDNVTRRYSLVRRRNE